MSEGPERPPARFKSSQIRFRFKVMTTRDPLAHLEEGIREFSVSLLADTFRENLDIELYNTTTTIEPNIRLLSSQWNSHL